MWSDAQTKPQTFVMLGVKGKGDTLMALALNCSKCSGQMEEGLVVDLNYKGAIPSMWVEDQTAQGGAAVVVDTHKRKVKTITYRCSNCGFLDSYAK
jgi:hypothetical protein